MPRLAVLVGQFGIAEIKPDTQILGEIEQGPGLGIRHARARKTGRSRPGRSSTSAGRTWSAPIRERRQTARPPPCASRNSAISRLHHRRAAVGQMDRPQLGHRDGQFAGQGHSPLDVTPAARLAQTTARVHRRGCRRCFCSKSAAKPEAAVLPSSPAAAAEQAAPSAPPSIVELADPPEMLRGSCSACFLQAIYRLLHPTYRHRHCQRCHDASSRAPSRPAP